MKKTGAIITSLVAVLSAATFAQADQPRQENKGGGGGASQSISVGATVPKFCRIGGSTSPSQLTQNIDTTGPGTISTSDVTFDLGAVVCNSTSTVQLSSPNGAMFANGVNPVSNFDHTIKYSARLSGFGDAVTLTAGNTSRSSVTSGAPAERGPINAANSVTVKVTPAANTNPILAGNYSDTITVLINPK